LEAGPHFLIRRPRPRGLPRQADTVGRVPGHRPTLRGATPQDGAREPGRQASARAGAGDHSGPLPDKPDPLVPHRAGDGRLRGAPGEGGGHGLPVVRHDDREQGVPARALAPGVLVDEELDGAGVGRGRPRPPRDWRQPARRPSPRAPAVRAGARLRAARPCWLRGRPWWARRRPVQASRAAWPPWPGAAPAGSRRGFLGEVNAAAVNALADPTVRSRFVDLGMDIVPRERQTPEALGELVKADAEK
jgi:hypothetical protein